MTEPKEKPVQQPELPMKDVTPPEKKLSARKGAAFAALKERMHDRDRGPIHLPPHSKEKESFATVKPKPKKANTAIAVAEPQAPKEAKNVLAIIADAASNPAINPTVMRELLDMQKEIMAEQSRRDFNSAFIALQADLSLVTIRRDGKIEIRKKDSSGERTGGVQQATPYATFNSIMKVVQPLLTKHGFALSFSTEPAGERLLVRGYLDGHGHQRSTAFPLPAETSGSKNNVQGWGSSMSYGKRYAVVALLNIISEAPEDRDTDGNPNTDKLKPAKGGGFVEVEDAPKISVGQRNIIVGLLIEAKIKEGNFCSRYGINQVNQLPAELFDAAKKAIKDHKAKAAANG